MELTALNRALADAFRAAYRRLQVDSKAAAEFRIEQLHFDDRREIAHSERGRGLAHYLTNRRNELTAIVAPRTGFEGRWIQSGGEIVIERRKDGRYRVVIEVEEPSWGAYYCSFNGLGTLKGNRMAVVWNLEEASDDGAEGWTLDVRRDGGLLRMFEIRNKSEARTPPYCGVHGSLSNSAFFPATSKP